MRPCEFPEGGFTRHSLSATFVDLYPSYPFAIVYLSGPSCCTL